MTSAGGGPAHGSATRVIVAASAASVACSMPLFLTGAMAVELQRDLAFSTVGLGAAVSVFRGSQGVAVSLLGRQVDRRGAGASLRVALALTVLACVGIAATARSWTTLVLWLAVGAIAKALVQPAANRMVVRGVPPARQGIAVGVIKAAAPIATTLAGLSVPVVMLTVGWRWAFALSAVLAASGIVALGRREARGAAGRRKAPPPGGTASRRATLVIATAMGLGNVAGTVVPAFWVDSAVRQGVSEASAGTLLAVASVLAIATRVGSGAVCDRMRSGHMRLSAGLLAAGAVGLGMLAVGGPGLGAAGVILASAGSWGYQASSWFAVLRTYKSRPGQVTGSLTVGALIGSASGPLLFGALVEWTSYPVAWTGAAAASLLAAACMLAGGRALGADVRALAGAGTSAGG